MLIITKFCSLNFQSFDEKSKELETSLERLITKDEEFKVLQQKLDDSSQSNALLHTQVDKLDELDKIQVSKLQILCIKTLKAMIEMLENIKYLHFISYMLTEDS